MKKKKLLVPMDVFLKKIKFNCPIKSHVLSLLDIYECGCGYKHSIGCNGGKIIKQTNLYEYVVSCPKGYLTLIEYSFEHNDVISHMAIHIQQPNNAAVYGGVRVRPN